MFPTFFSRTELVFLGRGLSGIPFGLPPWGLRALLRLADPGVPPGQGNRRAAPGGRPGRQRGLQVGQFEYFHGFVYLLIQVLFPQVPFAPYVKERRRGSHGPD